MPSTERRPYSPGPLKGTERGARTLSYFRAADARITEQKRTTGTVARKGPLLDRRLAPSNNLSVGRKRKAKHTDDLVTTTAEAREANRKLAERLGVSLPE